MDDFLVFLGVRLLFSGSAYVHWTEQHSTGSGKNRRTETRHYSASESYFNFELLLFGPGMVLLSCQPRVTVMSCFVFKVIRDLESIYHLCVNPIRRIGLTHK